MKKNIFLNGENVLYTLQKSKNAKIVRLNIKHGGEFIVTTPYYFDLNIVEKFIFKKADWVIKKIKYFKNFDKTYLKTHNKKEYLLYKNKTLLFVKERLEYFNLFYNFKYNKISVKNQKTRFGSCSANRNLNFNYKIAKLPKEIADYVIIHELCHLKELNHSKNFWNLVSKKAPDYLKTRKKLKEMSLKL